MSLEIRRAVEADGPALIELRRLLSAETSNMLWEPDELTQTAEDESRRIAIVNERPNCLVILAEADSRPIGLLSAVGGEPRRMQHSTHLGLGVLKAYWGQGVATRMIEHVLGWSREAGLRRLELTVHTTNLRAVGVYLRCGFKVEGLRRSSLLVNGEYVDEYLMAVLNEVRH
jgi:RimJ/RimL family protein N-acetyltransferase